MKETLQKLANLQYIDSRIDELKQLRGDLPEEILDIETEINRQEARISSLEQEQKDLEVNKNKMDLEITDALGKTEKYEKQQTSVRNNREYDALTKEIESQKKIAEESEVRSNEIDKRKEDVGPEIEVAKEALEIAKKLHSEKESDLENVKKNTNSEEEKLIEIREKMEAELEERYLKSYTRLRNGLSNGLAVVRMEKGAALGMALPPQVQVEVRRKNKIIIDENSGRIVVDPTFFEEAEKMLL